MPEAGSDVAQAFEWIAAAIPHRSDLFDKWQTEIAFDGLHGPRPNAPIAIKNALLYAASLGLLDAASAERLAFELDCKPLARQPDIANFNPNEDAFWSLPMAIVWIMSRDWKQVAQQKTDYRTAHEHWYCEPKVGLPKDGRLSGYIVDASWQIRSLRPAAIDRLLLGDNLNTSQSVHIASTMTVIEAKRLLWGALQETAADRVWPSRRRAHAYPGLSLARSFAVPRWPRYAGVYARRITRP